jgi:hypothetical protein
MNGSYARNWRSYTVAESCTWTVSGQAGLNMIYDLLHCVVESTPTETTPGTDADLAEFTPDTSTLKSLTMWFTPGGLAGTETLRADYCTVDELTITNDGNAEDLMQFSASGRGRKPVKVAKPSYPALDDFPGIVAPWMQVYIDTASAIGTTAVNDRIILVEHTFNSGTTYKRLAAGAGASLAYQKTGRNKSVMTTRVVLELDDSTYYDQFIANTSVKLRVVHNGSLIEDIPPKYYHYLQVDTYGPWQDLAWGANVDSNRTTEFTIESHYDDTLTADYKVDVQTTDIAP